MSRMLDEIREQPAALERLLKNEKKNIAKIAKRIRELDPAFIMFAARGSSDNAATYGKYLIEYANMIPCSLAAPSVTTIYGSMPEMKGGVVIGVSQSGEGADINEVLDAARKKGAYTIGITNTEDSAITKVADDSIMLNAGFEKGLAATKTYTNQLLSLMLLSGHMSGDRKFLALTEKVPAMMSEMLGLERRIKEGAKRYRFMEHCVIVGRGFNYATVMEAALKLTETSYVVARPFSTADFQHGPIAMAGPGFPAFVCSPPGKMADDLQGLCADLRDKELETVIISSIPETLRLATQEIKVPIITDEVITPIFYIVPFQFLANFLSFEKGLDPDNPRFLKKVTCTY